MQGYEGALVSEIQSNFCPLLEELVGLTSMQPVCHLFMCLSADQTYWLGENLAVCFLFIYFF